MWLLIPEVCGCFTPLTIIPMEYLNIVYFSRHNFEEYFG